MRRMPMNMYMYGTARSTRIGIDIASGNFPKNEAAATVPIIDPFIMAYLLSEELFLYKTHNIFY